MTNMDFTLSPALQSTLTAGGRGNGVYAYAFAFQGATYSGQTTLVSNGVIQPASNLSLDLGTSFSSGTVYVVVQQGGNGIAAGTPISGSNPLGNINPTSAATRQLLLPALRSHAVRHQVRPGRHLGAQHLRPALDLLGFRQQHSPSRRLRARPDRRQHLQRARQHPDLQSQQLPSADRLAIGPATADNHAPLPAQDWTSYVGTSRSTPPP